MKQYVKRLLKKLIYSPFGRSFYLVLRRFYQPKTTFAHRLKFKGSFDLKTPEGHPFKLYNNAFVFETNIFWLGLENYQWERMTRKVWAQLAPHSATILDIGANSGLFAVFAQVYNPQARVFAFEPQPNIFEALKKNCAVNGFDIRCENIALSDQRGQMPFYNYGPDTFSDINTTAGSLNKDWRSARQSSIVVEVDTLEQYLLRNNIHRVDLIKIDVETHEFEVLKGYGELLLKHRPAIILEVQNEALGKQIAGLFAGANYQFFNIDESLGLLQVEQLWQENADRNYLLCPEEKLVFLDVH